MARYVLKRLLWMIPVVLGVAILIFVIMSFCPGDPAEIILGSGATEAELEAKREMLGLNRPFFVQLVDYLKTVFLEFDFGTSYSFGQSVTKDLMARLPRTLTIGFFGILFSVIVGVPLGITAAVHQNGWGDRISMVVALIGVSMPGFWLGLMLVIFFALKLEWLPPSGFESWQCYILPCMANSMGGIATLARQTRSSMLDVIRADYIVTARAKGVAERSVRYRHMLPNALIPIITVIGNNFGHILGGAVVTGGTIDIAFMRILDVVQSLPNMLLAIAIAAALGKGMDKTMVALGICGISGYARMMRASILSIRGKEYVEAACSINCSNARIIMKHIIPNAISPIIVQVTMGVGQSMLAAASLSYIGLGVQPPNPEWGAMLSAARSYIRDYPYYVLFPGLMIMISVLALNLVGDALRDALDPKLKN